MTRELTIQKIAQLASSNVLSKDYVDALDLAAKFLTKDQKKEEATENDFNFSIWLVDEMEEHDVTIHDVAKGVGVSYSTIKYYITDDRSPSLKVFLLLLNYFHKRMVIDGGINESDKT